MKKCKAITLRGQQCSNPGVIDSYCIKHFIKFEQRGESVGDIKNKSDLAENRAGA